MGKRSKVENKNSVNLWTKVALIAVAAIFVVSIALSTVVSSGILLRSQNGFSSANYDINGTMLQYMFQSQFQSFYSQFSSYMSYFSLDTNKDLRDQKFTSSTSSGIQEALISGYYGDDVYTEGTWFDFFWDRTVKEAKQMLVFCEAAKAMDLKLTDEDYDAIDASIDAIENEAAMFGYNLKTYIGLAFGQSVKESDIRDVMEMATLASKLSTQEADRILDEIKDEDVKAYFEANKSKYLKADYYKFSFGASLDAENMTNPTEEELRNWHALSGLPLKKFFNTSGLQYRALELTKKLPTMSEDEQFALLATDGMLVKRPLLIGEDFVLVGFKQAEWERVL